MNRKKIIYIIGILFFSLLLIIGIKKIVHNNKSKIFTRVKEGPFEILVVSTGELQSEKYIAIEAPGEVLQEYEIWDISIARLLPEGTLVDSGEVVAELDPSKLLEKMVEIDGLIEDLHQQLENLKIDTSLELSSLRDELLEKKYAIGELEFALEQSKYESPAVIKQANVQLEKAKREYAQALKSGDLKQRKTKMTISQIRSEIDKMNKKKEKMESIHNQLTVRSPNKGMLVYYKSPEGERIETGSVIQIWRDKTIAILPNFSTMISNTYVNEIDISKVKKGQKVKIGVDAFPDKVYNGIVQSVANIGEQLAINDAKVFNVRIVLEQGDPILKPGMTTSNKIITASFNNVIYIPIESIHSNSDMSYVFLPKGFGVKKQTVKLGEFNENYAIIKSGLDKGEKIYLSNPKIR